MKEYNPLKEADAVAKRLFRDLCDAFGATAFMSIPGIIINEVNYVYKMHGGRHTIIIEPIGNVTHFAKLFEDMGF